MAAWPMRCVGKILAATLCAGLARGAERHAALPFHAGSETLVVLPDTEGYTGKRPHILDAMMAWIAANREARHIVVTYDRHGADGQPLLACYRNGELCGRLRTGIRLRELSFADGRIGPFAGRFDEFRVYAFALTWSHRGAATGVRGRMR